MREAIIKRTGSESPNPQGLCFPYCEAREVYANPEAPTNSGKWSWMLSEPFRWTMHQNAGTVRSGLPSRGKTVYSTVNVLVSIKT